jgi:hypothetical protein
MRRMRNIRHIYVAPSHGFGPYKEPLCGRGSRLPSREVQAHKLGNVNCEDCRMKIMELVGISSRKRVAAPPSPAALEHAHRPERESPVLAPGVQQNNDIRP